MPPTGMRRSRPLRSSGTRAVSVLLVGIRKQTMPAQISHEVLLECDASSHRLSTRLKKKRKAMRGRVRTPKLREIMIALTRSSSVSKSGRFALTIQRGNHGCHPLAEAQIQRHESDRLVV